MGVEENGHAAEQQEAGRMDAATELLTGCGSWVWETDSELRFSFVSSNYEVITGMPSSAVLGRRRFDFMKGDGLTPRAAAHLADLEARRPFQEFVHELRASGTDCRWVSISGFPHFDLEGRFTGYRGVGRNVTALVEKLRSEEQLVFPAASLLADLPKMMEAIPIGMLVLDRDMRIEFLNGTLRRMWGINDPALGLGSPFRELAEASRPLVAAEKDDRLWKDYLEEREHQLRAGLPLVREFPLSDGRTLVTSIMPLSEGRRFVSYVDVTRLKQRSRDLDHTIQASTLPSLVLDALPAPIFVKDEELRFALVNKTFAALFNTTPEAMLGKRASDFSSVGAAEISETGERDVLQTGAPCQVQQSFGSAGDTPTHVTRRCRVQLPNGQFRVLGTLFDAAGVQEEEQEQHESQRQLELFRHVLDEMPVATFITKGDLTVEYVNRAWTEVTGVSREVAVGQRGHELFPSANAELHAANARHVMVTGELVEVEEPITRRDGSVRQLMTRLSRMRGLDGEMHIVGSSADITEIKAREAQLTDALRENEVFKSLIDNVPVSIYAKRPDLQLVYVNKGWCELTGYSKEEAIGRTDVEIFGERDGAAFMESDRTVLRTGQEQRIEETVIEAAGRTRHQMAQKSAMVASDGSLYLIGSTTDITELKEREAQLQHAQARAVLADRAKSEFLANMSHEIRTPMNGVLGMAELLARSDLDQKQKTFVDIIVKSGNALLTIINDILDFSKIDAGQLVLDPIPFDLAEAVEDVATLVSTRAKEKDLELIVRIDPAVQGTYLGDVGRIRQIVTNLVGNAVKFTDTGHVLVDVSGEKRGSQKRIRVKVEDTGIGIPADKLDLVFEKFAQVDASSTRRHEGTGLGLAITSRLVALMGGEMGVESREGAGSTFWFAVSLPETEPPAQRKPVPVDVTGARVLVIDDNAVNRAILSEQMAFWSFDACAASSGPEGLQVLEAATRLDLPVDCVILDYQMPGMTGAEVARRIRAMQGAEDTPIVMLTSVDQSLGGAGARDVDAQLIKPARSAALLDALAAAIAKRRSGRSFAQPVPLAPSSSAAVTSKTAAPVTPIILPALQPMPDRRVDSGGASPAGSRIDILVAEDNEVNQLVFTQILTGTGFSFQLVGNGRRACEAFREMSPRLILMDVSMPEMNGIEATEEIRRMEAGTMNHVPIIGVTAHALKGDRERCLEAGMDDYLSKPISPRALLEKIERWTSMGEQSRTGLA